MLFESSTTLTNSVLAAESTLATLEPDGKINYHRFLQRYVLVTSESVRLMLSIIAQIRLPHPLTDDAVGDRAGRTKSFVNFTMQSLGSSCHCVTCTHC